MQILVKRSQRTAGLMGKAVHFCSDIRAEYTEEERANINRYGLGSEVIYSSRAASDHLERSGQQIDGTAMGLFKGLGSLALAKMNLNITIASLKQGHHIECKDLSELIDCENRIVTACKELKNFLEIASTFDGREILVNMDEQVAA